eukprot:SAG11_NODE_1360_length_5112_cov_4.402952_3_plen_79_part_00
MTESELVSLKKAENDPPLPLPHTHTHTYEAVSAGNVIATTWFSDHCAKRQHAVPHLPGEICPTAEPTRVNDSELISSS